MRTTSKVRRAVQTPRCPHCQNVIELLEPSDVDEMGLLWPKRRELLKRGELIPWAILRNKKFWLYLKQDVDNYLHHEGVEKARKDLKSRYDVAGAEQMSDEAVLELEKQIQATIRRQLRKEGLNDSEDSERIED